MTASWKRLEDYVRSIASLIYSKPCSPEHIAGINIDGVIHVSDDEVVLIEITENRTLDKVREDILKLANARMAQFQTGVSCKAFVVLDEEPTLSMVETGKSSHVTVSSAAAFAYSFFSYSDYVHNRARLPFGSAVDSVTGENDTRTYVQVSLRDRDTQKQFRVDDITRLLAQGSCIVLYGDYGTGKSRLVRETFEALNARTRQSSAYPLAINLRDHWGSSNYLEILAGHLAGLGLSTSIDNAVRLLNSGHLILLLDGFDEIGAQSHDVNISDRQALRKTALRGIRDLISRTRGGVLLTGRSQYFDDDSELLQAIGKSANPPIVLETPSAFSPTEAKEYLSQLGLAIEPPAWLPRKPLVFQIAAELEPGDLAKILKAAFGPFEFWGAFLTAVTKRESRGVQDSIPPTTILSILTELGGLSRYADSFLGRFTPSNLNEAYQRATGSLPDAVGQQLLLRMCTLGRIEAISPDRQFLDSNIADILRAEHLIAHVTALDPEIANTQWKQALSAIGIAHAQDATKYYDLSHSCFTMLTKFGTSANRYLLGELVSVLASIEHDSMDFKGLTIQHGRVPFLHFGSPTLIQNLRLHMCEIDCLSFDATSSKATENVTIHESIVNLALGISNASALPNWITSTEVVECAESVANSARIKGSNLPGGQKLLLSIIHKLFFQKGAGREEAALLKGGYGQKFDRTIVDSILKRMMHDGLIDRHKGNDGWVYVPIRRHADRMARVKSELGMSDDELWKWAAGL